LHHIQQQLQTSNQLFLANRARDCKRSRSLTTTTTGGVSVAARDEEEQREITLQSMRWGLIPSWQRSSGNGSNMMLANARSETVSTAATFRRMVHQHRCVVVVDGFYEWYPSHDQNGAQRKQPYFVFESTTISKDKTNPSVQSHSSSPVPPSASSLSSTTTTTTALAPLAVAAPAGPAPIAVAAPSPPPPHGADITSLSAAAMKSNGYDVTNPPMYLAALFDEWTDRRTGKRLFSVVILTTAASQRFSWSVLPSINDESDRYSDK
jgi:putative SOS response-associated peptidase YedK